MIRDRVGRTGTIRYAYPRAINAKIKKIFSVTFTRFDHSMITQLHFEA